MVGSGTFGIGSGPIYLDDLRCTGTEDRLVSCPQATVGDCSHVEDVGVRCPQPISKATNNINQIRILYYRSGYFQGTLTLKTLIV